MALSFYTDFGSYTLGVQPSDWSTRWLATNSTWQVVSKSPSTSGRVLQHTATASARRALIWNAVGLPNDCDVKARLKTDTKATLQNGVGVRISGVTQFAENGYFVQLASRAQLGQDILFGKYVAGAFTELGSVTDYNWSANTYYFLRLRCEGTTISAKYWGDSDTEPVSFQFSVTDASLSSGGAGVIANTLTGIRDYDQVWIDIIPKPLVCVVSGSSVINGVQLVSKKINSLVSGLSEIDGSGNVNRKMFGSVEGVSEIDPFLKLYQFMISVCAAATDVAVYLKLFNGLMCIVEGLSSITGANQVDRKMIVVVDGVGSIIGEIEVDRMLIGLILGNSQVLGLVTSFRCVQLVGSAIIIINLNGSTESIIELGGSF